MSTVIRMEKIEADIQEPLYDGGFRPASVPKHAWMCRGCGLVWPMKHQATDCESRKHVSSYAQEYWTNGYDQYTGKPNPPTLYPREAIRRETLADFNPDYTVEAGGYLFYVTPTPEQRARKLHHQCGNPSSNLRRYRIRDIPVWTHTAVGFPLAVFVTPEQAAFLGLKRP